MRKITLARETKETKIALTLNPDGNREGLGETGIPFFDHMLTGMAKHARFDLSCTATGDLGVDCHHTIEDVGIVLGDAVKQAMGDGRGIRRFAHAIIPMDESLAQVALDCGGRGTWSIPAPSVPGCSGTSLRISLSTSSTRFASMRASRPTSGFRPERSPPVRGNLQGVRDCAWKSTGKNEKSKGIPSTKGTF